MGNYLFKVFYNGSNYTGFQRQPGGQSVENFLEFAFIKARYIDSFKSNEYKNASRTDSGVSAFANIFTLKLTTEPVLERVNRYLPSDRSIIIWAFARVDDFFNPKYCKQKTYYYFIRYHLVVEGIDIERIQDFKGTHDFTKFIKKDGAGTLNPVSNISKIHIQEFNNGFIMTFQGDRFGREQIRKMIGFILEPEFSELSPLDVLNSKNEITIPSAPSTYLILFNIKFHEEINWKISSTALIHIKNCQIENIRSINKLNFENLLYSQFLQEINE